MPSPRTLTLALIAATGVAGSLILVAAAHAGTTSPPPHDTPACPLRDAASTERTLQFGSSTTSSEASNLNNGWAPDSRHIAYADPVDGSIKVYDTESASTVATLTPPMNAEGPEWSVDGRHIYFSTRPPSNLTGPTLALSRHTPPDMYVVDADGSDLQKIVIDAPMPTGTTVAYWDSTTPAKVSADGRHVAFSTVQGLTSDSLSALANASWVMLIGDLVRVDGTPHLTNVREAYPPSSAWQEVKGFTRDGTRMLMGASSAASSGNPDVYTLDLATGALTRYTSNPAWEETMDVNPAAPDVVFSTDRDNPTPPTQFGLGLTNGAHHDLYLAGPAGDAGWTRRLTNDGDPAAGGWDSTQPRWSPDGRHVLFRQTLEQTGRQLSTIRFVLLTFSCAMS